MYFTSISNLSALLPSFYGICFIILPKLNKQSCVQDVRFSKYTGCQGAIGQVTRSNDVYVSYCKRLSVANFRTQIIKDV